MGMQTTKKIATLSWLPVLLAAWPSIGNAQVPVDENGAALAAVDAAAEEIPLLSATELESLVGGIALYPDDLLAVVLPASTYPLQLVQAERFLRDLKNDSTLKPDEDWDDSIVALINYPEVVELLTKDLDKTWRLGEAVVAQQSDVIAAIESFRDRAYAAGNLQSDEHQSVSQNEGVIEITPLEEDVIYVPYYEPERVVVYQPTPAYYYYPRSYPVYYYPYPYGYSFNSGFFWGVTTAFTVGWLSDSLHVYHHSYYGHPYYGHSYGYNYWYRRPSIHVHNNYYYNGGHNYHSGDRYGHGDYWRPHSGSTVNPHDQRVTRSRHYPGTGSTRENNDDHFDAVSFRQRKSTLSNQSSSIRPASARASQSGGSQSRAAQTRSRPSSSSARDPVARTAIAKQEGSDIKFRQRTPGASKSEPPLKFRERSNSAPQSLAANRSTATRSSNRDSQPSRSHQNPRSTQSQRPSQKQNASQPSRSPHAQRPASKPSRSSQPKASRPSTSRPSNSASKQVASASRGRSERGSSRRR